MTVSDPQTTVPVAIDRRPYTRAEMATDLVVHVAALVLALGAVPVLITLTAVWRGDAAGIAGVSVYGGTLILMLTASLAYNHLGIPSWAAVLRRLDMSAIHLKIAGTYTPFALLSGAGSGLLAAVWGAAGCATAVTLFRKSVPAGLAVGMCLVLGWAVVVGGWSLLAALPWSVIVLMVVGGVIYSAGTPFLLASDLRFHNTIWHGFVVTASIVFFVAIFLCAAVPLEIAAAP
ncbi:hypothetical protein ATO8_05246 [Roseivivax marinus]|jgi:hemolysin III|uniref:Hly-III family protein n=1 Tax=Roseivivax marinus TaxID=1379903 RepID=W4HLZ7_9RHOB|nr:hemolysin III family protein [Roseivivax marinus]ETW13408.1 hypothetical protein ATO8_05246 [Roseivivax marinus]UMA64995.1 hemolysin III family protein [Roseivivax marinus]SEK62090.1 hemolysin III [Roseivivax marinus]